MGLRECGQAELLSSCPKIVCTTKPTAVGEQWVKGTEEARCDDMEDYMLGQRGVSGLESGQASGVVWRCGVPLPDRSRLRERVGPSALQISASCLAPWCGLRTRAQLHTTRPNTSSSSPSSLVLSSNPATATTSPPPRREKTPPLFLHSAL
jgi:hypothetical protein